MSSHGDQFDELAHRLGADALPAALAEPFSETPPDRLRPAVLEHAARSPRSGGPEVAPTDLYRAQAARLRAILDELGTAAWMAPALPYAWSVHGLVAHLLVIERYTAFHLGLGPCPAGPMDDHLGLGVETVVQELHGRPADTAHRWWDTTRTIVDHLDRGADLTAPLPLHGWPFGVGSGLVVRSFELWTHAEDICRAIRRPLPDLPAAEARTMSRLSVNGLPFLLQHTTPTVDMAPCRVVLTGPGGGTFDLGGGGPSTALLVADVVDYCRVVARRLAPTDLPATVEGDHELIGALLSAASAIAV